METQTTMENQAEDTVKIFCGYEEKTYTFPYGRIFPFNPCDFDETREEFQYLANPIIVDLEQQFGYKSEDTKVFRMGIVVSKKVEWYEFLCYLVRNMMSAFLVFIDIHAFDINQAKIEVEKYHFDLFLGEEELLKELIRLSPILDCSTITIPNEWNKNEFSKLYYRICNIILCFSSDHDTLDVDIPPDFLDHLSDYLLGIRQP